MAGPFTVQVWFNNPAPVRRVVVFLMKRKPAKPSGHRCHQHRIHRVVIATLPDSTQPASQQNPWTAFFDADTTLDANDKITFHAVAFGTRLHVVATRTDSPARPGHDQP